MILDGHIHIRDKECNTEDLFSRFSQAGVEGGVVISLPPEDFRGRYYRESNAERLNQVLALCGDTQELYPFFWIDPLAEDAADQVREGAGRGIAGIKIICDRFHPGHEQAMNVYRETAKAGLPILFHSGVLWDGAPSSVYNRPAEFEVLLEVEGLRFSLAHISWPWCDECIAVYGKFLNAYAQNGKNAVEMYIDTTPGTPPIFRKEALTKLYTTGYDVEHNVIFGTDCYVNGYNADWVKEWHTRDTEIMNSLGIAHDTIDRVFSRNLQRFLGLGPDGDIKRRSPQQAE